MTHRPHVPARRRVAAAGAGRPGGVDCRRRRALPAAVRPALSQRLRLQRHLELHAGLRERRTARSGASRWPWAAWSGLPPSRCWPCVGLRGQPARPAPAGALAGRVAGYIFALSVVGLSVVLYLGVRVVVRPEDLLPVLLHHLLCGDRDLPGLGRRGGRNHDWTASARPRRSARARRPPRWRLSLALAFGAGAVALVALFPRQVDAVTGRGGRRRAHPDARSHRAEQLRPVVRQPAARAGRRADRRREGADRQVQRLSVPAVPDDVGAVQAGHRQVHARSTPAR